MICGQSETLLKMGYHAHKATFLGNYYKSLCNLKFDNLYSR